MPASLPPLRVCVLHDVSRSVDVMCLLNLFMFSSHGRRKQGAQAYSCSAVCHSSGPTGLQPSPLTPSYSSSTLTEKLPFSSEEHYGLAGNPLGIGVFEDQPSSLIAYTLASPEHSAFIHSSRASRRLF